MSDVLLMYRNRCGFISRLSRILIMHRHGASVSDPRGGGQRDRDGFANPSLSLRHLSTHPGESLRRDITADRVVYTNIGIRNPVLSLIATSIGCAAVCVRAGIACISVGMLGLCRTFFICADGKKTAFVCAVREFGIAADRGSCTNSGKLKSVSPRQENLRYKASITSVFSH